VTARLRNALGGAETLEANASIGTRTKSAYQVSPLRPSRRLRSWLSVVEGTEVVLAGRFLNPSPRLTPPLLRHVGILIGPG